MRQARVIARHRAPDRPAILVARGDTATLGDRDHDWPEFVWSTLAGGLGGWIPESVFDVDRDVAIANTDYDSRELNADVSEQLILHREMAGWWWAEKNDGATGWIPARAIELIDEDRHG